MKLPDDPWTVGGIMTICGSACVWVHGQLSSRIKGVDKKIAHLDDVKVSKDVFEVYQKANDEKHDRTYDMLKEIRDNTR